VRRGVEPLSQAAYHAGLELRPAEPILGYDDDVYWGRPVSTWVANLQVRAEAQCPR